MTLERTSFFTVECIFKRSNVWVAVLDVVIRPPRDPLSIKRNLHPFPIDELVQLERVFLK